jgi:uncharacterized protein HemY
MGFHSALRAEAYETAEKWIQEYLRLCPEDWNSKAHLTTAFLYQRKYDAMIELAQKILKVHPENFISHVNLAVLFFEREEWNDARQHIIAALKHKPNDTFLNEALAKVCAKIQRD